MADDAVSVGRDILQQILSSQKKLEKQGEQQQKQLDKLEKALDRRSSLGAGGSSSGGGGDDDDMKPAALLKRLKAGKANAPAHFDAPYWMAALHARTENAQTCCAFPTTCTRGRTAAHLHHHHHLHLHLHHHLHLLLLLHPRRQRWRCSRRW